MARDNYSYQKYRRELAKKKKKEDKLQRKLDKKNAPSAQGPAQAPGDNTPVNELPGPVTNNGQDNKVQ